MTLIIFVEEVQMSRKIVTVALFLSFTVLAACGSSSSSSDTNTASIVGTWLMTTDFTGSTPSDPSTIVFSSDGTYTDTTTVCSVGGTYTTSGSQLSVAVISSSGSGSDCDAVGDTDTVTYTVTSTTLTLAGTDEGTAWTAIWTRQ